MGGPHDGTQSRYLDRRFPDLRSPFSAVRYKMRGARDMSFIVGI